MNVKCDNQIEADIVQIVTFVLSKWVYIFHILN